MSKRAAKRAAKIANAEELRRRINERIAALHTTQAAINEKCGFKHSFLNDFLVGKKHSMLGGAMSKLIDALETTGDYLILGKGSPTIGSAASGLPIPPASLGFYFAAVAEIAEVTDLQPAEIAIESLDLMTGEIMFRGSGDANRNKGVVLDPAVYVANNDYAKAFASREPLAIFGKIITLRSGHSFLAVLHSGPKTR